MNHIVQCLKYVVLQKVFVSFENDGLVEFLLSIDSIDVLFVFTETVNFGLVILSRQLPVLID